MLPAMNRNADADRDAYGTTTTTASLTSSQYDDRRATGRSPPSSMSSFDPSAAQNVRDGTGRNGSVEFWSKAPQSVVYNAPAAQRRSAISFARQPQEFDSDENARRPSPTPSSPVAPPPYGLDDVRYSLPPSSDDRWRQQQQQPPQRTAPQYANRQTSVSVRRRAAASNDDDADDAETAYDEDDDDDEKYKRRRRKWAATKSTCVKWTKIAAVACLAACLLAAMFFGAMMAFGHGGRGRDVSPPPPPPPPVVAAPAPPQVFSDSKNDFPYIDDAPDDEGRPSSSDVLAESSRLPFAIADRKTVLFEFRVTIPRCELKSADGCVSELRLPPLGEISAAAIYDSSLTCTEVFGEVPTESDRSPPVFAHPRSVPYASPVPRPTAAESVPKLGEEGVPDDARTVRRCAVLAYDILADPETGIAYVVLVVLQSEGGDGKSFDHPSSEYPALPPPQCALALEASVAIARR